MNMYGNTLELESYEINMLVGLLGHLSEAKATTDLGKFMEDLYSALEGESDREEVNKYESEFAAEVFGERHGSEFIISIKNSNGEYK